MYIYVCIVQTNLLNQAMGSGSAMKPVGSSCSPQVVLCPARSALRTSPYGGEKPPAPAVKLS